MSCSPTSRSHSTDLVAGEAQALAALIAKGDERAIPCSMHMAGIRKNMLARSCSKGQGCFGFGADRFS